MAVIGYKRVRNLEGQFRSLHFSDYPMLASSGYKYSVEASVVSNSEASRRFFVFRGRGFDPGSGFQHALQPFG